MRRPYLALAVALAAVVLAPSGRAYAQLGPTGGGYDVFSFYYGYYLPHQAYMAAQTTPADTINQFAAQRQMTAQTDRSALYDPISPYGDEDDATGTSRFRRGGDRAAIRSSGGSFTGNWRGNGPAEYYGRTARYFPGMPAGRGANQNLARIRGSRGGGGGMPSMGGMGGMGGFN